MSNQDEIELIHAANKECDRIQAKLDKAIKALEFYADCEVIIDPVGRRLERRSKSEFWDKLGRCAKVTLREIRK